jgi:hypothetical protein
VQLRTGSGNSFFQATGCVQDYLMETVIALAKAETRWPGSATLPVGETLPWGSPN